MNQYRKGRCVLVILASQWDPVAVPALSVQRAIFLVLEILIQDPRNQVQPSPFIIYLIDRLCHEISYYQMATFITFLKQ